MKKYPDRYYKPEGWRFSADSMWMDIVWPVAGSKPGVTYSVTYTPKGFTCDCVGFTYHGRCKHALATVTKINRAIENPYRC